MPDFLLIKVIYNIDKQIGFLSVQDPNLEEISKPLFELRNNLLREFVCKSSKTDWTIKDPKALLVLKKLNLQPVWI
jgi:hypothetical protein